jgi:hypothetical protein
MKNNVTYSSLFKTCYEEGTTVRLIYNAENKDLWVHPLMIFSSLSLALFMPTVSLRTVDYENFILLLNVEIFNLKIVKKYPDTQKAPYLKTYLHNQPNPLWWHY